jgi:hypothetical protein
MLYVATRNSCALISIEWQMWIKRGSAATPIHIFDCCSIPPDTPWKGVTIIRTGTQRIAVNYQWWWWQCTATTGTLERYFIMLYRDFLSTNINTCIGTSTLTFNYNADKFYFLLVGKWYISYSIPPNTSITTSTVILQHDSAKLVTPIAATKTTWESGQLNSKLKHLT